MRNLLSRLSGQSRQPMEGRVNRPKNSANETAGETNGTKVAGVSSLSAEARENTRAASKEPTNAPNANHAESLPAALASIGAAHKALSCAGQLENAKAHGAPIKTKAEENHRTRQTT